MGADVQALQSRMLGLENALSQVIDHLEHSNRQVHHVAPDLARGEKSSTSERRGHWTMA